MEHPLGRQEPDGSFTYKSPNTGEYVMASQYIAEVMVGRKAYKLKKPLPYKYWNSPGEWQKEFKGQVSQAAILLKKYTSQAVVKAITELFWCYSLRTPKLVELIKKHDIIIREQIEKAQKKVIEVDSENSYKKIERKNKSMFGKLKEDNGPIDFI